MNEKSDRKELERRLEQAKRAAALGHDPVTAERLQKLIKELEEQLRLSEDTTLSKGRCVEPSSPSCKTICLRVRFRSLMRGWQTPEPSPNSKPKVILGL